MGANNYQYNAVLKFSADTTQAKTAIQELQGKLAQISSSTDLKVDATGIQKASKAAEDLQVHLSKAMNADTGKLDLNKFDLSLKSSGQSLKGLSKDLLSLGSGGKEAFIGLAKSVAEAERPMLSLGSTVKDLADSFKNTVKWQLSSSLIHGFMSCLQQAKGYAEDLNKSLTDIRIVSGASSDEMARFAQNANKAAKSLSSTTNAYAQAALIYYQQGLSDEEVLERTNVTIKMANAVGESASTISDQMTAVWNNFYDGSKTVEYYADVMTALGAATASSTDEIAAGLEKFASVAETVGLSYEYATAALTTITATTRQSADTVGTALKTLFARLEGLKLDGVTDDGTDLNKYSQALADVGVNIKDADGQLKDMDTILSETSNKWQQLSKNQQVALAQTVAGVRQYTQFIALMDNWDFMEENLETARNAEGTLTEQAEIYAESWEGAQKRVKASLESIYGTVIDDKFFIGFNNFLADAISGAGEFLKNLGGIKGLLLSVSGIVTTLLAPRIDSLLLSLKNNISILTGSAEKVYSERSAEMGSVIKEELGSDKYSESEKVELTNSMKLSDAKSRLAIINKDLSDKEKIRAEIQLQVIERDQYELLQTTKKIEALKEEKEALTDLMNIDASYNKQVQRKQQNILEDKKDDRKAKRTQYLAMKTDVEGIQEKSRKNKEYEDAQAKADELRSKSDNVDIKEKSAANDTAMKLKGQYVPLTDEEQAKLKVYKELELEIQQLTKDINDYDATTINSETSVRELTKALSEQYVQSKEGKQEMFEIGNATKEYQTHIDHLTNELSNETDASKKASMFQSTKEQIDAIIMTMPKAIQEADGIKDALESISNAGNSDQLEKGMKELSQSLKNGKIDAKQLDKALKQLGQGKFVQKTDENIKQLNENLEKSEKLTKNLGKALDSFNPQHIISNKEAVMGLVGGFQNLASVLNIAQSTMRSVLDPDLSVGEKFSALLTGITSGLTTASFGLSSFSKIMKSEFVSSMIQAVVVQQVLDNEEKKNAVTKMHSAVVNNELTVAEAAETLQKEQGIQLVVGEKLARDGLNTTEKKGVTTKLLSAIATGVQTVVQKAFNTQLSITAAFIAALVISVIGFIAILAGLVLVVKLVSDALHKEELALERSNKALEEAGKAADNAKEKYESLKETIKSLKETGDTLKTLKEGTVEWEESVADLNSQMLDLIDKYPELSKYFTIKDGVYTLEDTTTTDGNGERTQEEILSDLEKENLVKYQRAQSTELAMKVKQMEAQRAVDAKEAGQKTDSYTTYGKDVAKSTLAGAGAGAAMGAASLGALAAIVVPVIGAGVGAAVGSAVGGVLGATVGALESTVLGGITQIKQETEENYFEQGITKLSEALAENDEAKTEVLASLAEGNLEKKWLEDLGLTAGQIDALQNNTDVLEKTLPELINNKEAVNKLRDQMALENARNTIETKYGDLVREEMGSASEEDISKVMDILAYRSKSNYEEEYEKEGETRTKYGEKLSNSELEDYLGETIDNDKELAKKYLVASGAMSQEQVDQLKFSNGNGEVTYTVEGTEQSVSDDIAREFLFEQKRQEKANEAINVTSESVEAIGSVVSNASQLTVGDSGYIDISDAIAKGLTTGEFDFSESLKGMTPEELDNLKDMSYSNLKNSLNISKEAIEGSQFSSTDGFNLALSNAINNITPEEFQQAQDELLADLNANADALGLDGDAVEEYAIRLTEAAEDSEILSEDLAGNAKSASKVSLSVSKSNSALEDLAQSFSDASDAMKNNKKGTEEYAKGLNTIKSSLSGVLGATEEYVSDDFVEEHMEDIEKAIKGDEAAINKMRKELSEETALNIGLELEAETGKAGIGKALQDTVTELNNSLDDIKVGATIEDKNFTDGVKKVLETAGMTTAKANEIFSEMGIDVDFKSKVVKLTHQKPTTVTHHKIENYKPGFFGEGKEYDEVEYTTTTYHTITEDVEVPALGVNGEAPEVDITRVNSGSMASAPSVTKNKAGSGSGGGSSTPKKNNASKKDEESDRYHTITKQLENLKNNYDEISESKDRAFGPAKLALIDKEIKAQDKLIKKQKKYVEDIKKYAKEDLKNLKNGTSTYTNEDGKDIKINTGAKNYLGMDVKITDGVITNYDSLMKKADNKLEAARKKFNSKNSDNEAAKQEWEIAQAQYEAFKEAISKYEETQDLLEDETQNLIDEQRKLLDLKLEKIKFKAEFKLEVEDSQLEYLDYLLEKLEDKAYSTAQAIGLIGKEITNIQKQSDIKASGIKSILKTSGIGDKTIEKLFSGNSKKATSAGNTIAEYFKKNPTKITQDQMDQVKDYVDGLLDDNKTLMEYRNSVYEKVMESLDELNEVFDKQKDRIEVYSSMLDAYTNSINLLGRSVTGISASIQKQIIQKQAELTTAQFKIDKTRYEEVKKEYDSVMDKLNDDTLTDTDRAKLKETATSLAAEVRDAQKTVYSSWTDAIQAAADAFEQSIELNSQVYLENVSKAAGYLSESDWETQYEQQQEISSRTVEDYKKIYELSKLNRNINKEIGKSASVRTQSKLVELQKQLNEYAAQHVEMTQYDLDYMQKQYDLKLAEIALEEAQNAKSKVTMVRNSEGGFGYVYTTDENKIADAQQKYEDAYYAAQDLNTQRAKSDQDMLYQLNKEMNDAIAAVSKDDPNYKERVKQIQDYYMDKISFYTNDLQNVLNNNQTLYEQDGQRYHELTGYKITDNSALLESIKKTFGEDGIQGYMNAVQTSSSEMVESLIADHKTYLDSAKNLFNEMKLTMGEAGENSTSTIDDQIQKKLNEIDEKTAGIIESLSGNSGVVAAAKKSFEETVTQAENFSKNYGKEMDKTIAKNEAVIASFQGVYSAVYAQIAQQNNGKAQVGDYVSTVEGNGTYTIDKNKKVSYDGRSKATQGQLITAIQKATYNGTEYTFYQLNGKKWVTGGTIKGYDTGGYTGEWGDSGKLAILHQKELVLNQDQTKDLLQSVNILQSIQKQISLNTLQNALGLGIPGIKTVNTQNDSLQQDVSIQATFPNVTNHLEIETAFNNLINQASQYANRNN